MATVDVQGSDVVVNQVHVETEELDEQARHLADVAVDVRSKGYLGPDEFEAASLEGRLRDRVRAMRDLVALDEMKSLDSPIERSIWYGGWAVRMIRLPDSDGRERDVIRPGVVRANYWVALRNTGDQKHALCADFHLLTTLSDHTGILRRVDYPARGKEKCLFADGPYAWRLVAPGDSFTFLYSLERAPADRNARELTLEIRSWETTAALQGPFTKFSVEIANVL